MEYKYVGFDDADRLRPADVAKHCRSACRAYRIALAAALTVVAAHLVICHLLLRVAPTLVAWSTSATYGPVENAIQVAAFAGLAGASGNLYATRRWFDYAKKVDSDTRSTD